MLLRLRMRLLWAKYDVIALRELFDVGVLCGPCGASTELSKILDCEDVGHRQISKSKPD
jgi:hypothetical protein